MFLTLATGLDFRQREVFGPTLGPIYVRTVLGVCIVSTGFVRPGHTGSCVEAMLEKVWLE